MKSYIKLLLVLLIFAVISVLLYIVLKCVGVTDLNTLKAMIQGANSYAIIIFFVLQVAVSVALCFVPVLNSALILLGVMLFGVVNGFLVSWLSTIVSSSILFLLGDRCGEKLATKLIGKQELNRVQDLIDTKSKLLLPLVFIIPVMPDDAFCLVAGMTKMKYYYFLLVCAIFRGIDIALICFLGGGFINWAELTVIDWVVVINLAIIDIYLLFKIQNKIECYYKNKNKDK